MVNLDNKEVCFSMSVLDRKIVGRIGEVTTTGSIQEVVHYILNKLFKSEISNINNRELHDDLINTLKVLYENRVGCDIKVSNGSVTYTNVTTKLDSVEFDRFIGELKDGVLKILSPKLLVDLLKD